MRTRGTATSPSRLKRLPHSWVLQEHVYSTFYAIRNQPCSATLVSERMKWRWPPWVINALLQPPSINAFVCVRGGVQGHFKIFVVSCSNCVLKYIFLNVHLSYAVRNVSKWVRIMTQTYWNNVMASRTKIKASAMLYLNFPRVGNFFWNTL